VLARVDVGTVRLIVPTTTYKVDASALAHAGRVTVQVPTDPAALRQLSARVSRGDIQIRSR
jgi:hypothetical protein